MLNLMAMNTTPTSTGAGGVKLVGAIDARCRRVANGPKAPAGRFWPMPPRRPLMGGKGSAGRFGLCEPRLRRRTRWAKRPR